MVHKYTHDTVTIKNKGLSAVLKNQINIMTKTLDKANQEGIKEPKTRKHKGFMKDERTLLQEGATEPDSTTVTYIDEPQDKSPTTTSEIEVDIWKKEDNLFTRLTKPWKKGKGQGNPQTGKDRTGSNRRGLSVSEVKQVDNATHHLDIPPDTKFSTKVSQKPLTPPQRKYLYESIDMMLKASVIEQCLPDQVKCVSPTMLAQKVHTSSELTLEEFQH